MKLLENTWIAIIGAVVAPCAFGPYPCGASILNTQHDRYLRRYFVNGVNWIALDGRPICDLTSFSLTIKLKKIGHTF